MEATTGEIIGVTITIYLMVGMMVFMFYAMHESKGSKVAAATFLWSIILILLCIKGFMELAKDIFEHKKRNGWRDN